MAYANSNYSDVLATTIESRSGIVADNVTKNNALLTRLREKGRYKPFTGGSTILQELSFQANSTAMYYSGAEVLDISPADVISAAQFPIKQAAVAVTINGLEMLQNSGEEQIIDLFDARLDVAEASIENLISTGIYSDVLATTIESRSGIVADNVTKNNALLTRLREKGRYKPFTGGSTILQELSFQANSTAMYYSGAEVLDISPADVISAAQFPIKQAAVAVTINGLEMLQNSGEEQIIDLFDARLDVAEASIENLISTGIYSDGTANNGKQITGLQTMVVASPSTGVVGGIDRAT